MKRKLRGVPGKTMSLFADDPDLQGWRYRAIATDFSLPAVEAWRVYRGRAHCENRIKELKMDFGLDSFALRELWATEAALGVTVVACKLMSVFRREHQKKGGIRQRARRPETLRQPLDTSA